MDRRGTVFRFTVRGASGRPGVVGPDQDIPAPDVIFVPGGGAPTLRQLANPVLLDYVREADRTAEVVASVCTGSLLLAGAGLLQGRPATTHWAYRGFLDRLGARYVAERWVEDGRYLTGAGVSAGIDTALRLASRLASDEMSRLVQLAIEYDPPPSPRWDRLVHG